MRKYEKEYAERYNKALLSLVEKLELYLVECLDGMDRIDRVSVRAKSISRFIDKACKEENGVAKYDNPLEQIQDQIGARIIALYLKDVENVAECIKKYFRPIEQKDKNPESDKEFGYIGKHFILFLPIDILDGDIDVNLAPKFFELQIKTLFQHAWSEAEHDLGYKPDNPLDSEQRRRIAFTAAQAWGADHHFNELHNELNP